MVCETDGIKDAPDPVADLVAEPGVLLVGWPMCTLMASVGLLGCGGRGKQTRAPGVQRRTLDHADRRLWEGYQQPTGWAGRPLACA